MNATAPPFRRKARAPWASDGPMRHRATVIRPPRPTVLLLPEPRRLLGRWGPLVIGRMSTSSPAARLVCEQLEAER